MPEQPVPDEMNRSERARESRGRANPKTGFAKEGSVKGLRLLDAGHPLLIGLHLSTIAIAVQDRPRFEGILGPGGERLFWGAWTLVAVLGLRVVLRELVRDGTLPRILGAMTLLIFALHALGLGMGRGPWGAVEYDAWCAAMSGTWLSIPLDALGHLVGITLTVIDAKHSLSPPAPRSGLWAWSCAAWIAAAGVFSVFTLATGSGALF